MAESRLKRQNKAEEEEDKEDKRRWSANASQRRQVNVHDHGGTRLAAPLRRPLSSRNIHFSSG
jgi:hypothetical protein